MKAEKKKISDLTLCYCVSPLTYRGRQHFIVASEKEYACLLFDEHGREVDKIWDGPGGTMSAVQYPGSDGAFLATHKFYSPNNSKEARIVLCWPEDGEWKVAVCAELPFVHRFDILERDGRRYVLACCIKSDYEYKDDWRFPGMTLAGELPPLEDLKRGRQLELAVIREGMLKNHGYCRHMRDGMEEGLVTCDDGAYLFTPPAAGEKTWSVERLIGDAASDGLLLDLDGDGEEELITLSPFHGDTLRVYHKMNGRFEQVFEYEKKIEFAHAICGGVICGKPRVIIGYRKGDRDLLSVSWNGGYEIEVLDHDVGPANVMHLTVGGGDVLVTANREINEAAYYTLSV